MNMLELLKIYNESFTEALEWYVSEMHCPYNNDLEPEKKEAWLMGLEAAVAVRDRIREENPSKY